ncbi:hypothetical protein VPH35_007289 [Triticum aestivum]
MGGVATMLAALVEDWTGVVVKEHNDIPIGSKSYCIHCVISHPFEEPASSDMGFQIPFLEPLLDQMGFGQFIRVVAIRDAFGSQMDGGVTPASFLWFQVEPGHQALPTLHKLQVLSSQFLDFFFRLVSLHSEPTPTCLGLKALLLLLLLLLFRCTVEMSYADEL